MDFAIYNLYIIYLFIYIYLFVSLLIGRCLLFICTFISAVKLAEASCSYALLYSVFNWQMAHVSLNFLNREDQVDCQIVLNALLNYLLYAYRCH